MGKSRLDKRREMEAAEALEKPETAAKKERKSAKEKVAKDPTKRKVATRRTREKPVERKRAVWIIYSGSMKEEGRYPYDQKQAAQDRLEALRARGKRLYFLQMVKELITSDAQPVTTIVPELEDEPVEVEVGAGVVADVGDVDAMVDMGLDAAAFSAGEEEEEEEEEKEPAGEEE